MKPAIPAELRPEAVVADFRQSLFSFDAPSDATYREVPGFPGYRVGTDGSIWTHRTGMAWRRLKTIINGDHYAQVTLCRDSKPHIWPVHRLVLTVFVGPPTPDRSEARHLDGNKYNNHMTNLCWGSRTENMADMVRHGRSPKGERNGRAKLTAEDVHAIRALKSAGCNTARIARWMGKPYWTIRNVVDGTRWGGLA